MADRQDSWDYSDCPLPALTAPMGRPNTDPTDPVWAWLEDKGMLVAGLRDQLDAVELLAGRLYGGPLLSTVVAGELIGSKPQRAAAVVSGLGRMDANGRCEALNLAEAEVLVFTETGDEPRIMMLHSDSLAMQSNNNRAFDLSRQPQSAEVAVSDATSVAVGASASRSIRRAETVALIAVAREALGVAHAALELACEHARTRQVFDQPVGRFQGVAHPLAECYARLAIARSLADWALQAHMDEDPHAMVAASIARAACAEAAVQTSEQCVQVYGARGYRADYPAHLLLRRAEWTRLFQSSSADVFAETGRAVLAGSWEM